MPDSTGPGDYEPGALIMMEKKDTAALITKGDVLSRDGTSKGWKTCPTTANTFGPYAVAHKTYAAAATIASVVTKGTAYVTADAAISVGDYVMPSGSTAGRVIAFVPGNVTATPTESTIELATQDWTHVVGRYIGKLDENDGKTVATNAAQNDVIRVVLGT